MISSYLSRKLTAKIANRPCRWGSILTFVILFFFGHTSATLGQADSEIESMLLIESQLGNCWQGGETRTPIYVSGSLIENGEFIVSTISVISPISIDMLRARELIENLDSDCLSFSTTALQSVRANIALVFGQLGTDLSGNQSTARVSHFSFLDSGTSQADSARGGRLLTGEATVPFDLRVFFAELSETPAADSVDRFIWINQIVTEFLLRDWNYENPFSSDAPSEWIRLFGTWIDLQFCMEDPTPECVASLSINWYHDIAEFYPITDFDTFRLRNRLLLDLAGAIASRWDLVPTELHPLLVDTPIYGDGRMFRNATPALIAAGMMERLDDLVTMPNAASMSAGRSLSNVMTADAFEFAMQTARFNVAADILDSSRLSEEELVAIVTRWSRSPAPDRGNSDITIVFESLYRLMERNGDEVDIELFLTFHCLLREDERDVHLEFILGLNSLASKVILGSLDGVICGSEQRTDSGGLGFDPRALLSERILRGGYTFLNTPILLWLLVESGPENQPP